MLEQKKRPAGPEGPAEQDTTKKVKVELEDTSKLEKQLKEAEKKVVQTRRPCCCC